MLHRFLFYVVYLSVAALLGDSPVLWSDLRVLQGDAGHIPIRTGVKQESSFFHSVIATKLTPHQLLGMDLLLFMITVGGKFAVIYDHSGW